MSALISKIKNLHIAASRLLLGGAVAFVLIGSFFLPNIVAGVTDARTLDKLAMADMQGFNFDSAPLLGIAERIELVASRGIEKIPIKTGRALDTSSATDKAITELARCFKGGPLRFDFDKSTVTDGGAAFVINTAEPSVNMIVWDFVLNDPAENTMTITLDDETGVIIKVIYRGDVEPGASYAGPDGDALYLVTLELTEMIADYYRMQVILADYMLNGDIAYYKAELTSSDMVIPMYGIARAHVFTMNEQS